jgi:alkyl sulfatase BDS1-like metallo-beta-lactamase superfamily hydrolase
VNGPKAWNLDLAIDVTLTDLATNYHLTLRNGVLIYRKRAAGGSGVTLTLTKPRLIAVAAGDLTSEGLDVTGDPAVLQSLLDVLESGDPAFNIITP